MRPERKQELQTNELAQAIADAREFLNRYGSYVIGGAVAVVVIVALFIYIRRAEGTARNNAYQEIRSVSFFTRDGAPVSTLKAQEGLNTLRRIADEAKDPDLAQRALLRLADGAMTMALADPRNIDTTYLDRAEQTYTALLERFPERTVVVGRVLCALAAIQDNRFVVDQDPAHKEKALAYLERIRDDSRFNGTPFMTIALDRINRLGETFQVIKLAAAPTPPAEPKPGSLSATPPATAAPTPTAPLPPPLLARPPDKTDQPPRDDAREELGHSGQSLVEESAQSLLDEESGQSLPDEPERPDTPQQ